MNLILFIGNECGPCEEAEKAFRHEYRKELDSGEADIVNLDEDEKAQQVWMENDLPLAPTMIVISDGLKVITVLDTDEFLKKFKDQASQAVKSG